MHDKTLWTCFLSDCCDVVSPENSGGVFLKKWYLDNLQSDMLIGTNVIKAYGFVALEHSWIKKAIKLFWKVCTKLNIHKVVLGYYSWYNVRLLHVVLTF